MATPLAGKALSQLNKCADTLNELLNEICFDLLNQDETITGLTAETNAFGWGVDDIKIDNIDFQWKDGHFCPVVSVNFRLTGDHDEDHVFSADTIVGTLKLQLAEGDGFEILALQADLERPDDG
jgi:hypothetical protein